MKPGFTALMLVFVVLFAAKTVHDSAAPAPQDDPMVSVSRGDTDMNKAIAEAQETLPLFLAQVLGPAGEMAIQASLKVAVPTESGAQQREHIWVMPFVRLGDGRFSGQIDSRPRDLGDLKSGDTITFSGDQISDWTVLADDGLIYGGYTMRLLYPGQTGIPGGPDFAPTPLPAAWLD